MTSVLVVMLLAGASVASGCGGDEEPDMTADSPSADTDTPGGAAKARGREVPKESKAEKERRVEADKRKADRELRQLEKEDREFDREFEETPFDKLIAKLPIRKPPLFVEQYITEGDSNKLVAAVDRKRFICEMTPPERTQAVADFHREADRVFRRGGIDDFELVVTPLADTAEGLPALATARRGRLVSLTAAGRARGSC